MSNHKKIKQMLNQEIEGLTFNPDIRRGVPTDIMIIIRFEDEKGNYFTHTIAPEKDIAYKMIQDAIKTTGILE